MYKILKCLVIFGLLFSSGFAYTADIANESLSLILSGDDDNIAGHGRYLLQYPDTTAIINIAFISAPGQVIWYTLSENKNPKLFSEVKTAIEKHLDSWKGFNGTSKFYTPYGKIKFYGDSNNEIVGFSFYKFQNY